MGFGGLGDLGGLGDRGFRGIGSRVRRLAYGGLCVFDRVHRRSLGSVGGPRDATWKGGMGNKYARGEDVLDRSRNARRRVGRA